MNTSPLSRIPWNKGKIVGQKAPFKLREIWAIRIRLQLAGQIRDLAMFDLGIDSKPLKGQVIDTRYCRWSISTNVLRQVFLVSASGAIAPLTDEQTVTLATDVDRRGPKNIVQAAGYHTTCGNQMALINRQIADAEQNLAHSFPGAVKGDAANVERHLKEILKPVRVAER